MLTRNFWAVFVPIINRWAGSTAIASVILPAGTTATDTIPGSSKPYSMPGGICTVHTNIDIGANVGSWYGKGSTPRNVG